MESNRDIRKWGLKAEYGKNAGIEINNFFPGKNYIMTLIFIFRF